MKKILYLGLFLLVFVLAACGSQSTSNGEKGSETTADSKPEGNKGKVTVMKIGSTDKKDVAMGKAMYKFKEIVEKETDGSISVEVFPDSQLGGERDIIEGVQLGTIQGGPIGAAVMSNFAPRFNLWSLPFVFPTREASHEILDGPLGQEVLADLEDIGIIGFNFWESGIRNLTNSKEEIKSPDDLHNLKIRTLENQIQLDVWTELGAIPTPMAFPELFTALQQGIVDGQENPFSVIAEANFNEVQKYITETQHLIGVNPFIVNKKFFEGLSGEEQEAIRKAADEAQAFQREEKAKEDASYKQALIERGMIITELTPEERQVWADKIKPVYDKHKKEIGEDLVNKLLEAGKK
ncbi:TRAP transporter substrate-binding protein [Bacillus sp. FJAT-29790]|uniref:TRAP transporter substrate-binding protein n=1 Tax=Bacillus sp. FJAT-29790 TaxID=1895002 RepID=UPI001C229EF3|nr:TRAP transporter substrate-binding protein [Bacillus sp. FJAT-29790]MBU8881347.1 TRAP transporter substrate-binding protein [Bacillus sp. FJAT-29790]